LISLTAGGPFSRYVPKGAISHQLALPSLQRVIVWVTGETVISSRADVNR
jgi:hypothetical protein